MLNHVGIAVPDMKRYKEKYLEEGYKIIRENYDEYFLVYLCLMQKDDKTIELVYTNNVQSRVFELCSKGEEVEYHKCYEVCDIKKSIEELRREKFIVISDVVYSKLLFGNVCFLYSRENGIIELLEVLS